MKNIKLGRLLKKSHINEDLDAIKDLHRDYPKAKIYKAHGHGDTISAETTNKTWPTGAPILKRFSKNNRVHIPQKKFYVLETDKHWYIRLEEYWVAINRKKHPQPPFNY